MKDLDNTSTLKNTNKCLAAPASTEHSALVGNRKVDYACI